MLLTAAAIVGCVAIMPALASAQWWSARAPADFEECADSAEKAATPDARTAQFSECHSKFAGRRKAGGGYSYFDFMQNRNFDIAGPNPTPEEQKQIDEQYTAYLDDQRRGIIAAAFTAKQQQLRQAAFKQESAPAPVKPRAAASSLRSRAKAPDCAKHSFSCDWPRLAEGIKDLKKLFGTPASKAKRG